jgi:predicted GIY-YIG superfamily endonuclease
MYYVYILRCGDGSLYTGATNDVAKRLAAHNGGKGAKYTRGRLPLALAYMEACQDKQQALQREAVIKKMKRVGKLALIQAYTQ